MNKQDLISKIKQLAGISQDERAYLINLVNTKKKYGLVWEDKPEDVEEQLRENLPVLKEVKEKAILNGDEHPNHILIEGDNLHALTALTFTHEGKIDVIYIDPPYNTGNKDFKYNDSFVDKEDSYRHSKWLSFMDKRLRIAKRLLSEKGVIFISIDDYEQATLKLLCDEIFTEMNFVGNIIWQRSYAPINLKKTISQNHDFILIYCKQDFSTLELNKLPRSIEATSLYKNPDNDPRGVWQSDNFSVGPAIKEKLYEIITPFGRKVTPPSGRCWLLTKSRYEEFLKDNRIWFGKDGKGVPRIKRFLAEVRDGVVAMSLWTHPEVGHTQDAKRELKEVLHENENPFETVKPIKLIDRIFKLTTDNKKPYTILDFFAGSGTTLHATMALNAEDGGNRQCILVTNNEIDTKTEKELLEKGIVKDSDEFETYGICQSVTYERNKRVIQGYTNAKGIAVAGLKNNNLRYFKSEFVPSSKTEQNKRWLTQASTELLCIKENCYQDVTKKEGFNSLHCSVFTNGRGKYLVAVYHSRQINTVCEQLTHYIKGLKITEKVKLYAFSPEKENLVDDFYEVRDKIDAVPLPEAIYNAYRAIFRVLKLDKTAKAIVVPTDEMEGENTLFDNQDQE
jgi:adenine-specific DNA-methyltransferase